MILHLTDCDGIQLACRVDGQGTPCVLLHGFPFDGSLWDQQAAELARVARVIVPDLRGYGNSALAEEDVAHGVSMLRYAQDVVRQLDDLGIVEPVVLAGFSMGGYVAWQFALEYPERVRALVLCDTRAAADSPAAREARLQMAIDVLAAGDSSLAEGLLEKLLAPETLAQRPDVVERTLAAIRRASPAAIAASQRGMAARPDVRERLGQMDVPALLLVGQHDVISPATEMQEIASALPQGELAQISGAGHMSLWESPGDVTDALLRFVESLLSGS